MQSRRAVGSRMKVQSFTFGTGAPCAAAAVMLPAAAAANTIVRSANPDMDEPHGRAGESPRRPETTLFSVYQNIHLSCQFRNSDFARTPEARSGPRPPVGRAAEARATSPPRFAPSTGARRTAAPRRRGGHLHIRKSCRRDGRLLVACKRRHLAQAPPRPTDACGTGLIGNGTAIRWDVGEGRSRRSPGARQAAAPKGLPLHGGRITLPTAPRSPHGPPKGWRHSPLSDGIGSNAAVRAANQAAFRF